MAEKIGRKVDRMDANQRRRTCSQLSLDERDMLRAIDQVAIDDHAEGITFAFERHLDYPLDAPLGAPPILDQIGDGADLQIVPPGERDEFGWTDRKSKRLNSSH